MSFTTRIAAAQDALATLLRARGALAGVTVDVGRPLQPRAEHIWLEEDIAQWTQSQATTGDISTAQRDEEFFLPVVVAVKQTGDGFTTVRDRALVLAGEVEQTVRANHKLSNTVFFAEVIPVAMDGGRSGTERLCVILLNVRCDAILQ